jgi:hypothetical protein
MNFRISGLDYAEFAPLFRMTEPDLAARNIVKRLVDERPGFPCRVSLEDAHPGETVLLVNYEHLAVASPYRSRHAIYVRENAQPPHIGLNEIPEVLRTRLLSLRAFDSLGMMLEADVTHGRDVEPLIRRMLANERVAFIHAHNAKPGCFAARIERAT